MDSTFSKRVSPALWAVLSVLLSASPSLALPGMLPGYNARHIRHAVHAVHAAHGDQGKARSGRSHHRSAFSHIKNSLKKLASHGAHAAHIAVKPVDGRTFYFAAPDQLADREPPRDVDIVQAFVDGTAGAYSPAMLRSAKVFVGDALRGGIYSRRKAIAYIILHSTETERPADAQRVIKSWNNRGMRHPGAQFVVDRDGTIYNTVDPSYATVHVNTYKTISGIDNDNTIGIEIVHSGKQTYSSEQVKSVACLVSYLQGHYRISNEHIYTHHFVQPSDRTDPVNFNWQEFAMDRSLLGNTQTAYKRAVDTVAPAPAEKLDQAVDGDEQEAVD